MSLAEDVATPLPMSFFTDAADAPRVLNPKQVAFYHEHGYLHIPAMFNQQQTDALADDLEWLMDSWAIKDQGWTGPWRKKYMDAETEKKSKLIALHDLQYYSDEWARVVTSERLARAMADLLGPVVELHHSTLHVKPPETGHPFPMHQDCAFYKHVDGRYVDVLVHLDDTRHENGEIRFLAGSHKSGPREHVTKDTDGKGCTPHLPMEKYRLEDTVPVPARRGDVVCFNIFTVHGSHINTTDRARRLVRVGYKSPANEQLEGQSKGRPSFIVHGRRPYREGDVPLRQN
jgi:ectoine hydroxylase-related dioxygenase (phytanoyl-CoA dioxygenase family)